MFKNVSLHVLTYLEIPVQFEMYIRSGTQLKWAYYMQYTLKYVHTQQSTVYYWAH